MIVVQFCFLRLYFGIVSCLMLKQMARTWIETLKTWPNFLIVLMQYRQYAVLPDTIWLTLSL